MIKVGVVGATGYTGVELLRILVRHPRVEIACVTSRAESGKVVSDIFPVLRGYLDLLFCEPDSTVLEECELVFFATPHAVAMHSIPRLLDKGVKVIDLSADFRLKDVALWEKWYQVDHAAPALVEQAVYGLPELNRLAIKDARLIACPGCYPTAAQLGFLPLLEQGLVDASRLIANVASGVSGAGRKASLSNSYSEVSDSFAAYGASGHRHQPEILQGLRLLTEDDVGLTFVPHLLPMNRGILATLYAQPKHKPSQQELQALFESRYQNETFVDVLPAGSHPQTRIVKGSNSCRLAVHIAEQTGQIVVLSVIDNLVKGAAGQAVQCFNIIQGFEESLGLLTPALIP